ncbi:MAG TPA: glycosyltransferase family 1 protein [Mucilaginibacter sp.]|jgi:glycosyltransferase involved in cell wall biosynthesis
MKIGVWIDGQVDKNSGGSYTYINTLIKGIDDFNFTSPIEIVFISLNPLTGFNLPCINLKPHQDGISFFKKALRKTLKIISKEFFHKAIDAIDQKEKRIKDESGAAYLKNEGVKIIFYPMPASHIINGIPFILNNWDLAHFTTYSFPEITDNSGFHKRNDWFVNTVPYAIMVLCETEAGKKELSSYLNLNPDKIRVLPMFSSNNFTNAEVSIERQKGFLKKLALKEQHFFFYPAQFWAHKNHYHLIKAFKQFVHEYPDFKLVLCGSDKGNIAYIRDCVKRLELEKNVIFSGFIEDDVLYALYKNASALIMPTFLGPSNIPPLEALSLNCPILCSNLEGHVEMLNNAALYFNPLDDNSILDSMKAIMDKSTREQLLQNQSEQLKITHHNIEKALIKLEAHFNEAINIRSCWE